MDINQEILDTANAKAISLENRRYVLFWDTNGKCRAISGAIQNLHFSVPTLDDLHYNYSDVVFL